MLKVQAVFNDGSVALEFMTDDIVESGGNAGAIPRLQPRGRGQSSGRAGMVCSVRRMFANVTVQRSITDESLQAYLKQLEAQGDEITPDVFPGVRLRRVTRLKGDRCDFELGTS